MLKKRYLIGFLALLGAVPALVAQATNFDKLVLAANFERANAVVAGYTGGSYSLSTIAMRDRDGNVCIGYGDPTPDHLLVLEEDFSQLTLKVDSRIKDTTLVIQGSDGSVRCSFSTRDNPDAVLSDTNWKAGEYKVWVGSINANQTGNYTLSARQN